MAWLYSQLQPNKLQFNEINSGYNIKCLFQKKKKTFFLEYNLIKNKNKKKNKNKNKSYIAFE